MTLLICSWIIIAALGWIIIFMKIKIAAQKMVIEILHSAYQDTNSLLEALTEAHKAPVHHDLNQNPNKFRLEEA